MKYFVAYLLSGTAKAYHERLTRELASRYRIYPLHERVVPHITIKAPFECDESQIHEVERVLRSFAHNEGSQPLAIRGFGRFGFRTMYLDIRRSPGAVALVRKAIRTVNEHVPWITKAPLEGNKLHASVARFMTRKQARRVSRYLALEQAHFDASLDNIAILKKVEKTWSVESVIPLRTDFQLVAAPQFDEEHVLAI